jgi:hypothetical protein
MTFWAVILASLGAGEIRRRLVDLQNSGGFKTGIVKVPPTVSWEPTAIPGRDSSSWRRRRSRQKIALG